MFAWDPWCLDVRAGPAPVEGLLPPVWLVEGEDLPERPAWMRWLAGLLAAFFAVNTALVGQAAVAERPRGRPGPLAQPAASE